MPNCLIAMLPILKLKRDNVRVHRAAGDGEIVGADKIAKLSAETSYGRSPAASWSSHCYTTFSDLGHLRLYLSCEVLKESPRRPPCCLQFRHHP